MGNPNEATADLSPKAGWKLVWHDEFDGPTIDRTKWTFDIGDRVYVPQRNTWLAGWGEYSLQYHTDRPDNVFVKDGYLTIRARREDYEGCAYTSARMNTKGLFEKLYGRFEVRARLPVGQGLWPALSLLPADNTYGLWAASGEIDIMEAVGQEPSRVLGTIHFGSTFPHNTHDKTDYTFPHGGISDLHVYALEWEPCVLRWYVDDNLYATKTSWWSCSQTNAEGLGEPPADDGDRNPFPAPFDRPFYLHVALAVGGMLPGAPDSSTPFPADMVVDYVRAYDRADA
jgi:beta-glucanase (GH16 family)